MQLQDMIKFESIFTPFVIQQHRLREEFINVLISVSSPRACYTCVFVTVAVFLVSRRLEVNILVKNRSGTFAEYGLRFPR